MGTIPQGFTQSIQHFLKRCQSGVLATGVTAALAVGGVGASTAVQADALEAIESRGTIRIAVPQDFPPFGSVGTDLQPRGYDIDMANYIADEMGVTLELITVTSANRIPYLQTGQADLVISSLGKTRSVKQQSISRRPMRLSSWESSALTPMKTSPAPTSWPVKPSA